MSVVVLSNGASGTNMILEILRGSPYFNASRAAEEKHFFKQQYNISGNHLTKCDTTYVPSLECLNRRMRQVSHLIVVWPLRDPRDSILSRINTGSVNGLSADASPSGCIDNMKWMFRCYKHLQDLYPSRMVTFKMEDLILNIEEEVKRLSKRLNIDYIPDMLNFIPRLRYRKKRKRANYTKLDKSQVALWKNWRIVYNGFFSNEKEMNRLEELAGEHYDIEDLFKQVEHITKAFGY